jgi:hypothetical protein
MPRFINAETRLKILGHEVINPATVNHLLPKSTTYEQYMDMSLLMLSFCDSIYLLDNWQDSPGANREKAEAERRGLKILYEERGVQL